MLIILNIPFWAGNEDLEDEMDEQGFVAVEPVTDPSLQALNEQDLPPASYALELLKQHTLNRQQILAVAPIVWSMEQMFQTRSDPASHLADGTPTDRCRTLWLGAGGSGKTYAWRGWLCGWRSNARRGAFAWTRGSDPAQMGKCGAELWSGPAQPT